ncbi:MAG: hypothetical protein RRA94_07430 [Bacteroidota bacterium]|nr:hypothetical protein [Bacteroidota bacterium]
MKKTTRIRCRRGLTALLFPLLLLPLLSCGDGKKEIPKEETGEPNFVPSELQRYREARETFRDWVTLFERPRETGKPFSLLSATSVRRLANAGVGSADAFADWVARQEAGGRAPFIYEFSRFDILDIDIRDSLRAVVTASFLVHRHQNTFESVSSFFLQRENGNWKVPFAESGNYESSWWQKEKNFLTRLREEGMATFQSDSMGITFDYPMTWDITSGVVVDPKTFPARRGLELQYIDPASLEPAAIIRIAVLPPADTAEALAAVIDSSTALSRRSESPVSTEQPIPMQGTLQILAAAGTGRRVAFLTLVANETAYSRFEQTFETIRKSIILNNEVNP